MWSPSFIASFIPISHTSPLGPLKHTCLTRGSPQYCQRLQHRLSKKTTAVVGLCLASTAAPAVAFFCRVRNNEVQNIEECLHLPQGLARYFHRRIWQDSVLIVGETLSFPEGLKPKLPAHFFGSAASQHLYPGAETPAEVDTTAFCFWKLNILRQDGLCPLRNEKS